MEYDIKIVEGWVYVRSHRGEALPVGAADKATAADVQKAYEADDGNSIARFLGVRFEDLH